MLGAGHADQEANDSDFDWLADGLLGPHVDALKQHLADRRFAAHTYAGYLSGITHFARWGSARYQDASIPGA